MEEVVIADLNFLLENNIYQDSEKWSEYKEKFEDSHYLNALFNIVLSPQSSRDNRILCISALLNFKINPPPEIIPHFFPLLYNEEYQKLIADYIVGFCDCNFLCQTVFPALCEEVQGQELIGPITGLILCFYDFVRIYKVRDETILQIMFQILVEKNDLPINYRRKTLEAIILQLNLINAFDEKEVLDQDIKNIMTYFLNLSIDSNNFPLFEYLLYFIDTAIFTTEYDISSYESDIFQKIDQIFNYLDAQAPLDPENCVNSTILHYLADIIDSKKFIIPFDKVFPLIIIGPKQFQSLQTQADYFFSVFVYGTDDFNENDIDLDEDEEDRDQEYDCIEDMAQCRNPFRVFKDDFANSYKTLNDSQYSLANYISHQSDEYIIESIQNCLSIMNKSLYTNISILHYYNKMRPGFPIIFNPKEFNCYENPILQSILIEFCQTRVTHSMEIDPSANSIYFSYLKEFNYHDFIKALIDADNSILALCAFDIVISAPREFINQYIFETVFKRSILTILDFPGTEIRSAFIEHVFTYYLSPSDTLNKESVEFDQKLIYNEDQSTRRLISDSIFIFPDQIVLAFKEDSQSLFDGIFNHLFSNLRDDPQTIKYLSELIYYFAGGNINQYLSRYRSEENSVVNINEYNVFFQEISNLSPKFIMEFLSCEDLIDCGYTLFAYSFINIDYSNNEEFSNFIDNVYQIFLNDVNYFKRNRRDPNIFKMISKIFIKHGKYLKIDNVCCQYISRNIIHIGSFIYQISFILINKIKAYPPATILSITKFLLDNFFQEVFSENPCYDIIINIGSVFARLSLSCSKDYFFELLNSRPYKRNISTVDLFLSYLFKILQEKVNTFEAIQERFFNDPESAQIHNSPELIHERIYDRPELIQKLFIAMYHLLPDHPNASKKAQFLLFVLIKRMNFIFTKAEIQAFLTSTFGLVKDEIFYDDQEFLIHPLISAKIYDLIQLIVDQPLNEEIGNAFISFRENFPNL